MTEIAPALLDRLRNVDTPTVCNAIEVAQGRRGFSNFTRGTMVATEGGAPIVGFARTATIRGSRPSDDPADVVKARRLEYFRAMERGQNPGVAVIQDLDFPDCVGAWWGEVHAAVHKGLGLAGALTDGLVRDLGNLVAGFPIVASGLGVSHGFVHLVGIGGPVEILGLRVNDGDLIHADCHGALVVPKDVLGALNAAIDKLEESENLILKPALAPDFDIDTLTEAWREFEKART